MPEADAKKKGKYQIKEDRRTPIDEAKKEEMLAVLIRNQAAFETVVDTFKVSDCKSAMNEYLALVWKVTRQFYKKYGELPGRTQLESEVFNAIAGNKSLVGDEERPLIDKFLAFAWDDKEHGKKIAKSNNARQVAVDTCKLVMEELVAADLHAKMLKEGTLPEDLPKLLQESQTQLEILQGISDVDLGVPFPDGWDKRTANKLVTTGVDAFDAFMGGGWRAGECLLFMAPYGSCKTATACHSTAELVKYAAQLLADGKARVNKKTGEQMIPVVVLVFTESDKDEYRNRLMANLGRVPWKKLADMTSLKDLHKGKKPGETEGTEYELKEFADKIAKDKHHDAWKNEQTRVKDAVVLANQHLILVDCTDSDGNPFRVGAGGMHEVANVVKNLFRKRKNLYPIAIWIDHLSGLIDRMGDVIKDEHERRYQLTNMPRIAIEKMGKPLKCPVGLMHQFSGEKQKQGVTGKLHHSDGEGSKSIGKYANFCVVSGKTDDNLMCLWECTKHRREPPTSQRIVKLEGDYSRLVDATKTHGIPPGQKVIMSKEEMKTATVYKKATSGGDFIDTVVL